MRNTANKNQKRFVALLLLSAMLAMLLPVNIHAKENGKKVRVGWYDSVYHQTDVFGRRSGYGYDYQQRIATFTGWDYEYVDGSWPELFEKLVAGEIDLLCDVSYTEDRVGKILFSSYSMGSEDYHAYIDPDNTEITPDDLSTFNGKRVGVNKNSIQAGLFKDWAESHGLHPEIVELTAKQPELMSKLHRGDIDVLVTLDAYGNTGDVLPVCRIGSSDSYFGVNKNRPDIKRELDSAMSRILESNRYYDQQLAEKYARSYGISGFLTPDELKWLSRHGAVRIGYKRDYLPFCGEADEDGKLGGVLADYITYAENCEKNAVITFETKAYDRVDDAISALRNNEIDCIFPINLSLYDGEKQNIILTDPLVTTEVYAAVRTADRRGVSEDRGMIAAIVKGNPNFETFLMDFFPNWSVAYYDSGEEAFRAVAEGRADCVLINSYRLNRVRDLCDKYQLSPLATGEAMYLSFAIREDDINLFSIINKTSRMMPGSTITASLTNYSFIDDRVTIAEFIKDNMALVMTVVSGVAFVIIALLLFSIRAENRAMRERQLISAVELDSLTGLYNRNFFFEYAARIHGRVPEPKMDAVVINVEQFHSLNELYGRVFGDHVLQAIGEEIRRFLEGTDGIGGRFEGDRFYVFCEPVEDYRAFFDRFQKMLKDTFSNASIRLRIGVSPWQEGTEPMRLFDQAKTASSIIRGSKKHLMVYDLEMRKKEERNQRLSNDLIRAIRDHELHVYYQPKYYIQKDVPTFSSAEALIRWKHPELGMIPPSDFIPLFEENGQVGELDKYVWREAVSKIASWRDKYGVMVPVSVNLSRVDALDPMLEKTFSDLLSEFSLDCSCLHLEVTESAYTEDAAQLSKVIQRLRSKGHRIEMDDFGSGFSSLNMLSSLPIDVLKIDMAFIQNIDHSEKDVRLVELILDIAKNLKVPAVAEGVETEAQLKILKDMGCALVQGYYFSRPLPEEEFEETVVKGLR